jgi:calcium-dependent protein kinase
MYGTPFYTSPEAIKGKYTDKCDVWSIGVIAFQLLTGSLPFDGSSSKEVLEKIQKISPNFTSQ